ncbi:hypothetical protein CEXT_366932 [Caerostris extrusa]|uniref:Uncharacterized protein n=1 Tax=Caerostris extrusa TaxID=172846 RepID=A0AAV4XU04_CAEEX|nr:hypothetical protein CEXT_366932 [Caerostris extrusa]
MQAGPNPCELRCEAVSEQLVYGFGKAADGTPCTLGVCLDGRCLVARGLRRSPGVRSGAGHVRSVRWSELQLRALQGRLPGSALFGKREPFVSRGRSYSSGSKKSNHKTTTRKKYPSSARQKQGDYF